MIIKKRVYDIIEFLFDKEEYTTIKEISEHFKISMRTVRYDIEKAEELAKKYDFKIYSKPGSGIKIISENDTKEKFLNRKEEKEEDTLYFSKEDRKQIILFKLFQSSEPINISDLEEELLISSFTIKKDLEEIEKWLNKRNLKLIRRRNFGIKIKGKEVDIRHGITSLLDETSSEGDLLSFLNKIQSKKFDENNFFNEFDKLIGNIDMFKIEKNIKKMQKDLNFKMVDSDYAALMIHIALAIMRIKEGKDIIIDENQLKNLIKEKEFNIARILAKNLEYDFNINIPESEIGFITFHLLGSKKREIKKTYISDYDNTRIMAEQMCKIIDDYFKIDLINDQELINGLSLHLDAAINRVKYNLPLNNPLLDEIKTKYEEIYKASEIASKVIFTNFENEIADDEIGYIALHFGAAIERNYTYNFDKLKVLLVCSSGIGTTNILKSRIKNIFGEDIEVLDTISYVDIPNYFLKDVDIDLIITTISIEEENIKILKVNPLLPEKEIIEIKNILNKRKRVLKNKNDFNKIDSKKIINIIKKYFNIDKDLEKNIKKDIDNEINKKKILKNEKNLNFGLEHYISLDTIKITNKILSWEQSIKYAGEILLKNDKINKEYIQKSIDIIKEKGPYSVISPGIALIHASPQDGVLETGFSFLISRQGVKFNSKYDPVYFLIMLAAKDKISHLEALGDLIKSMNDDDFIKKLLNSKNKNDVYNYIMRHKNDLL